MRRDDANNRCMTDALRTDFFVELCLGSPIEDALRSGSPAAK